MSIEKPVSYTGDLSLSVNDDGDWDITYVNGQPKMTDGFDTYVLLAVFGEPGFWQNELADNEEEKYISEFPSIIATGKVNNATINSGNNAIKNALKSMISSGMAKSITVTGSVISVYGIQWTINITRDESVSKYAVTWEKGVVEMTKYN